MFFFQKSTREENSFLLGVNHEFSGDITLQNLLDFLQEKKIKPSDVPIRGTHTFNVSQKKK